MAQEFVDKADLVEAQRKAQSYLEHNRKLTEENHKLKKDALEEAERLVTARLLSRFSRAFPEYPGYDGLTEVELPDGLGKVQLNVSDQEPGRVHLRAWGKREDPEPGNGYDQSWSEDFRMTFTLSDLGIAVEDMQFHKRFR